MYHPSNRDDQRVIIEISEQAVDVERNRSNVLPTEKCAMKSSLKKSKMFVETAGITSDTNEPQIDEIGGADDEPTRCFDGNPLLKFSAKVLDRRHVDEGQSTAHSRLTVYENNAYEDMIPSLLGRYTCYFKVYVHTKI